MSQLGQLKERISALAQRADTTAQQLAAFEKEFSRQVGEVQATIGGSAQRKDQEVIERFMRATQEVREAAEALRSAGKTARDYSASI